MDRSALKTIWAGYKVDIPVGEGMDGFHAAVLGKLQGLSALARRRMKALDPDLAAPVARARRAEVLQGVAQRLRAEVEMASRPIQARRAELKAAIRAKLRPPMPDDPIQAMRQEAKILALRRELMELPKAERISALWDAARRGLPGLLQAVEGGLKPMLDGEMLTRLESLCSEAVAPDETRWLQAADAQLDEAERAAALATVAMANDFLAQDKIDPTWQTMTPAQLAAAWPQERKAAFVAGHGQQAFEQLLRTGAGYELPADAEPIPTIA